MVASKGKKINKKIPNSKQQKQQTDFQNITINYLIEEFSNYLIIFFTQAR